MSNNYVYGVEKKASGRARCNWCREKIKKGTTALWRYGNFMRHSYKFYFCRECALKVLDGDFKEIKSLAKQMSGAKRFQLRTQTIEV